MQSPRPPRSTPRRPVTLTAAAALVLATLLASLLAACGSDIAPTPSPSPAPLDSFAPDGGSAGSPGPVGVRSRLSEFEGRLRDATTREGPIIQELGRASAGTAADLRLAVGHMRAWASGEADWLAAHPADTCYAVAGEAFAAAIEAMGRSADWFEASVTASVAPSDDVTRSSLGTEAANALQDVSRNLVDAAARAKTARTDCA